MELGVVMGAQESVSSFSRILGPLTGGFVWVLTVDGKSPFDYHTAVPLQNLPCNDLINLASTRHVLRTPSVRLESGVTENTITLFQPAGTILTDVKILCTEAVNADTCDIGYRIGITDNGGEIVAAVTDEILANGTTVALGAITYPGMGVSLGSGNTTTAIKIAIDAALRSGIIHDVQSDTPRARDIAYTATERQVICTITNDNVNITSGKFCFIFGYEYINKEDGAKGTYGARTSQMTTKINVYSFAINPEEHQPSGTCNFSRIDAAYLEFGRTPMISITPGAIMNIYAVNYNVLRIMSGMGGLAYSN